MDRLVLYYSRTGTTRLAADRLAEAVDADLGEIEVSRYRGAFFGYARAGYDSLKRNVPSVTTSKCVRRNLDLLVLATPVWTSYPATPMRAFLLGDKPLPKRVALLLTYGGHSPAEKAFDELEAMLQFPAVGRLALKADEVLKGKTDHQLAAFGQSILAPTGK